MPFEASSCHACEFSHCQSDETGPLRQLDCWAPPPICHVKTEASDECLYRTPNTILPPFFVDPRHPFHAEREAGGL